MKATDEVVKILLVEDVRLDAELEIRELRRAGMKIDYRVVDTKEQFLSIVKEFPPDVILSDFSMPLYDGMAALAVARETCPFVPFIFVSGTLGEEYAIRALQKGAADYVLKTNLIRLPAAVTRALREARELASRHAVETELRTTRERLNSIFESLDDAVWSWSVDSRKLTYVAPAAKAIYGRNPEEFLRRPALWQETTLRADLDSVTEAWQQLLANKGRLDIEYRIVRPNGDIRWVNNRARLFHGATGAPERIDGIVRDITERMEQQRRIEKLARVRDLSSAVSSAIVRLRDRQLLAEEVCRVAVRAGGFRTAGVVFLEQTTSAREIGAAFGENIDRLHLLVKGGEGTAQDEDILNLSLQAGEFTFINDPKVSARTDVNTTPANADILLTASLPLIVQGKVVGALVLRAPDTGFTDVDEIRLLKELAGNFSFGLELISKQERIDYLAYYDALTGLPNRTLFHDRLTQAIRAADRDDSILALAIFNVVRLKVVNDSLGERAGDAVLRQVAQWIKELAPDPSQIARIGGDLFAVMLAGVRDPAHVTQLLGDRRLKFFDQAFEFEGRELRVSARAGVALYPADGASADSLFHNAESALKQARHVGEQLLFYATDVNVRVAERLDFESRLRAAVEKDEFELHYQPKIDLNSRRIVGLEALIRWRDPERGIVSPAQFIGMLEDTGLILEVGRRVMRESVNLHQLWRKQGIPAPRIAVNISALQLRHKDFVSDVQEALRGAGDDVGLDLEITESMLMENFAEGIEKLHAIRDMGVQIAIDDFGTGYSSLAYISRLPVNALKIDRSFIDGMTDDPDKTSIVSTIISLGHSLRLEVVAEGVETDQQAQLLRLLRCDQMQGYLLSRPVPAEEVLVILQADKRQP